VVREPEGTGDKVRSVIVGTLTPSSENATVLRAHLLESGLATVAVEVTEYCRTRTDFHTRRFLEVRPDVILIDTEDLGAALSSIQILHTALPSAWILACTKVADTDSILKLIRAGAREVVPMPLAQDSLSEALQRHIEERDRAESTDTNANGKIYTICSAKHGSGATTMAINLAASLSESKSARVVLIDLDWPVGDASAFLNIKPKYTIADALGSVARLDSVLLETYMHKHDRFHVLAGLESFTDEPFDPATVAQLLEVVAQTYTHAVVDIPPSAPGVLFQTVTSLSTAIMAVVTPDLLSVRRTERLLRLFNSFELSDRVRLVLNRSTKSDQITDGDIEKALQQPVASKLANDYYSCIEAINSGKALLAMSNRNLARNYKELADELLGTTRETEKRKGLLGLLPKTSLSFSN
jgi:pilus assembly protein CpaE